MSSEFYRALSFFVLARFPGRGLSPTPPEIAVMRGGLLSDAWKGLTDGDLKSLLILARKSVYVHTLSDDSLTWSPNAASALRAPEISGVEVGGDLRRLLRDDDCAARDVWIADRDRRGVFSGEYRLRAFGADDGRWVEEQIVSLPNPPRLIGILSDIHERREREAFTEYLASYDQLTGLLNRGRLREHLAKAIADCRLRGDPAALLMIGVDNMSGINDAYGYDVADEVIVNVSNRLQRALGPADKLGRVSGAKFAFVAAGFSAPDAEELAARIRHRTRETVVETNAGPVAVTVSIGVACAPEHGLATHDVLAAAEEALSEARDEGPDTTYVFQPCTEKAAARRRNINVAEQIVSAYSEGRLILAYQPVVRADDPSAVMFYECLIRMRDKSGEIVAAADFMPVAEKLGLVRMLDRHVLERAFEVLRANPHLRLSINLSPQSAQDSVWLESFLHLAEGNSDVIARLIVEITESTVIKDARRTAQVIDRLRKLGCAFALDDFGAGYTSFRHFKDLRMDMVKIDGAFVRGVSQNRHNQLFVRALSDIARNFDMMTVAEMVSDERDAEVLLELGVDALQGYLYGKPDINPPWLEAPQDLVVGV